MSSRIENPLWKKDSGGLYIDLFSIEFEGKDVNAIKSKVDNLFSNLPKKDNSKASEIRSEGNELFEQGKFRVALKKYNQSLCYVENGSDDIALSYSNRAKCYLKLKLFNECLNDIEMARKCNYPPDKLDSYQSECLKEMSNAKEQRIDSRKVFLSYNDREKFEGIAECLEIENSAIWGRHLLSTRDLNIDETVLVEEPFSFVGVECNSTKYKRCSHCFKVSMNFIPCSKCVYAMFCDDKCLEAANKSRHKLECQLNEIKKCEFKSREKQFKLVLDILSKINYAFVPVEELIQSVLLIVEGRNVAERSSKTLKHIAMILQMETNTKDQSPSEIEQSIVTALTNYFAIMKMSTFREKFVTEREKRFLQHLILQVVYTAKHAITMCDLDVDKEIFHDVETHDYGMGIYPFACLLNHSCSPNVYCYSVDDHLICKVIRPIKEGEQLFRSYMAGQLIIRDVRGDDRQAIPSFRYLKEEYNIIHCKCQPCERQPIDPTYVSDDHLYRKLREVLDKTTVEFFEMSEENRQINVDRAINYLRNYNNIHETHETFITQMYLQNYWMITTERC